MSSVEQFVPLTEADREILKSKQGRARNGTFVMGTGAVLLLVLAIVLHSLFATIIIVCFALACSWVVFLILFSLITVSRDLRLGQKQLISGPVEAQDVDVTRPKDEDGNEGDASYRWWIQVSGKKITVTEDQYYQFKKGDLAEAFVSPNSGVVLGVSKEFSRRPFG